MTLRPRRPTCTPSRSPGTQLRERAPIVLSLRRQTPEDFLSLPMQQSASAGTLPWNKSVTRANGDARQLHRARRADGGLCGEFGGESLQEVVQQQLCEAGAWKYRLQGGKRDEAVEVVAGKTCCGEFVKPSARLRPGTFRPSSTPHPRTHHSAAAFPDRFVPIRADVVAEVSGGSPQRPVELAASRSRRGQQFVVVTGNVYRPRLVFGDSRQIQAPVLMARERFDSDPILTWVCVCSLRRAASFPVGSRLAFRRHNPWWADSQISVHTGRLSDIGLRAAATSW